MADQRGLAGAEETCDDCGWDFGGHGVSVLLEGDVDRVMICATCGEGQGIGFAEALRGRVSAEVQVVECMNQCDRPVAMALRGTGRDAYLFAGVDTARDLEDAVGLVQVWQEAEGGTITDARPAGRLRHCLVGRVPG